MKSMKTNINLNIKTQSYIHEKAFNSLFKRYVKGITSSINNLKGDKIFAKEALGLLITKYDKNIQDCYYNLINNADKMDTNLFTKKMSLDFQLNINYIKSRAPRGFLEPYLYKYSKYVFEEMKRDLISYTRT
ncbi:MAG: hypothetical protein K0B02_01315 [DPANN group archaeon]|nr:hypothetical protein [DPANN group archaeon]